MRKFAILLSLLVSTNLFAITGSTYYPSTFPLDASKVQGSGQGVSQTVAALATTNIDLDLTDDYIISGLQDIVSGASNGDYITMSVVLTANKSVVIATPIPGPWYVPANGDDDFHLEIPMKIQAGWTLRISYHATVILVTPTISINYKLWKVLI